MNYRPEALEQPYVGWDGIETGETFQQADNAKKMKMFDAWADYSMAYLDKRKKEAPETDAPRFEEGLKAQADWIKTTRPEFAKQYTLEGLLSEEDDTNTILETLKDVDGLKAKGFSEEQIQNARKRAEDFVLPQMEAFNNNLGGLAGPSKGYTQDELRQKVWEEPNLGDHLRNIENGLANGFTSMLLGTAQGLSTLGDKVGIPGAAEAADWSREYKELFAEQLPLDPRMNWVTNAVVSGATQAPAQMLTAPVTAVQVTANFGQMYAEDSDSFFQAEKRDEFERRKAAGVIPEGTPFAAFEKSLSTEETEQMRANASWKAIPSSLLNTVGETVSEKLALKGIPWTKTPFGKTIQKKIDNLRKANPKTAVGARMFSNVAGASTAEAFTEGFQGITSKAAEAAFYDTTTAGDVLDGIGENMVAGASGGTTMSLAPSATRAFREQAMFEDATAIADGTAKSITGLRAQRDAAIELHGDDSPQAKTLQRSIDTLENEAHYTLSQIGAGFDETKAAKGKTTAEAKNTYRNQLANWIKENQVGDAVPEKQIADEQTAAMRDLSDNVSRMRAAIRQNGDSTGGTLEAGLDQYEKSERERIQREANDKRSKADQALADFVGSVEQDGPGRAAFARVVVSQTFPDFAFTQDFNDDASVVGVLDAMEQGLITDKTDLTEWLSTPLAGGVAAPQAASDTTTTAQGQEQGLMTKGERLDALRIAEDNLSGADENTTKEFGRLKEDLQFWSGIIADKDSSEQDKAEAMERLPELENTLLEIATGVSSQRTNQNDQDQTTNAAGLSSQEISQTGATGEGTGAGGSSVSIRVNDMDGTPVDQTQEDYTNESREIVKAFEAGEMSGEEVLQNVEAVRAEIEAAPELSPEQKAEWFAPFEGLPRLVEYRSQSETNTPTTSTAPAAASPSLESTGAPGLIAGEGTVSGTATPVRMNSVPGDVLRTEAGEVVFRDAANGAETVLRVKEGSIDKDPATLTVDDFESGDGAPLVSEANKQFSVLPQNEQRPVRPFFRSERPALPQDGQTAKSSGSYPEDASSTLAPATPAPDIAAISTEVRANPDQHMRKEGNRKLVSREAAVTILSQLPETLTNKDVATLAKDSGMSAANFRKLAGMRGNGEAMGSILNGDMDAELGLFERSTDTQTATQENEAPEVALEDTPEWQSLSETSIEDTPEWQTLSDEFDKHYERVSDLGLDADTPRSKAVSTAKKLLAAGAISQRDADEAIRYAQEKGYDREDAVSEAVSAMESGLQYALEEKQSALRQTFDADLEGKRQALRTDFEARRAQAPAATTPATEVSNDTATESASLYTNQSQVDRWSTDALASIEQRVAEMPKSRFKLAGLRTKLETDEGRAEIKEKLGQMFNTVARNLGVADPIVREQALDKIFRGAKNQRGRGLTQHVLNDLLANIKETGDPFSVRSKGGEIVGYSAWGKYSNRQKEFLGEQGTRDMTDKTVENMGGASTTASQGVQEEMGEGGTASYGESSPEDEANRNEAQSMMREASQQAYDTVASTIAEQYGLDKDAVKVAVAKYFQKKTGIQQDFDALGWATPTRSNENKAVAALEAAMPDIQKSLVAEMTKAVRAATLRAQELGYLKSDPVISGPPTLEQIIFRGVLDEIRNPDFYGPIQQARETRSVEPIKPLLESLVNQGGIELAEAVAGHVLNNGKQITNSKQLASLSKEDMQSVLDSGLLPTRVRQTLQAMVDLSGEDGLGLVRNSSNEGFRRLAELYTEQIGNRAPVEVVFNLALNPSKTGQGLWRPGQNKVHISPFLTREQGLLEATILHEAMHPIWDGKISAFLDGRLDGLSDKDQKTITELQRLFVLAQSEAAKQLEGITNPAERSRIERDLIGAKDLREFLNEALNHKPFQDFLNGITDPESDGKTSVFRTILNKILELIRGGKVSMDSVLQRAFELSTELASSNRTFSMDQRPASQVEYIRSQEKSLGRMLTPEELSVAAVTYAIENPRPTFAESEAEADFIARETFTPSELDNYNALRAQEVMASDAYEFVSPNDLEETLDLNGAINELGSERQAQLREFSGRVHEFFGMQSSTVTDAIGDWVDGAEPTTVTEHNDLNLSYEDIKVMAALKGALRNQKGVLPFKVDDNGQQFLYDFFIPEKTILEARDIVDEAGIKFRTLVEQNGGTRVLVFDEDGSIFDAFADLITKNNYESKLLAGNGGLLGSWDSREEGKDIYKRTVEEAIARLSNDKGRDLGPDSPEGIRIASLGNLAAEAGLTLDPAPELSVIEALTGQLPTQDEINRIAESARVGTGASLQETAAGVGPQGGSSQVSRQAVRPNAEPNPFVKEGIRGYNSTYGIAPAIEGHYAPVSEQRARDIAAAYEALPVFDEDAETQEAYAALGTEIQQQWDYAINEMGVTFEPWIQEGQPYANSREMVRDVRDNKHLWFFTGGEPHPLLNQPDADGLTMNDKLRAIHDLYGHAAEDYQFGARGEENAWIKHSQMFSPLAQKALTTETRGQNSWVNFGPQNYNEDGSKKSIPAAERPFAVQKVALLPEEFMDWQGALSSEPLASRAVGLNKTQPSLSNDQNYENQIRFIYTTGSRPTDSSSDQGNLGGAYESTTADERGVSPADAKNSGKPKEESARRAEQFGRLVEFAKANGMVMPGAMFKRFFANEKTYAGEGAEHIVYRHRPSNRVIKITRADDIGDGTLGARGSASDYLGSMLLGNAIFGDDIRFEGLVQLDGALPQVVLSQKAITGRDATPKEIAKYMESLGFTRKEARKDVGIWEHKELGVDVYDAVPNNVLRSEDGNIYVVDVDVIPKRPIADILESIRSEKEELYSAPVPASETLGKLWQEAAAKEGGDAFAYGEVSPEVKSFPDVLKAVLGEDSKNFPAGYYSDGNDVTVDEWDKTTAESKPAEIWVKDPDGGVTVFFSEVLSGKAGIFAVNSAGTKTEGSGLYQAFYAWAHNNGKIVGPDSSLSKIGQLRRTSQMLSSALRFGTTQHMRPSPEQKIVSEWRFVEVDENGRPWEISRDVIDALQDDSDDLEFNQQIGLPIFTKNGDEATYDWDGLEIKARVISMDEAKQAWAQNIGLLAAKESQLVFERIPELNGLSISKDGYLFGPDEEYPGSTRALPAGNTEEYLRTLKAAIRRSDPEFAGRIGPATLGRALATRFSEANFANPTLLSLDAEGSPSGLEFSPFTNTLYSAPVQSQSSTGFNPTVYTRASRRQTEALSRVMSDPEYGAVARALQNKTYFKFTEAETLQKANDFIDKAHNGDLSSAFAAAVSESRFVVTSTGLTPEQSVLVRGIVLKRAASAANIARAEMNDPTTTPKRMVSLQFIEQHYSNLAETFAENLMEEASMAGQELRSFRLLADALAPKTWVRSYKKAAIRSQRKKFESDPVLREMMMRVRAARKDAASDTAARMQKALDLASKRFLKEGTSDEQFQAHQKLARLLASGMPIRDEVVKAAVERTVIDGVEAIRKSVSPDTPIPASFLKQWENRLMSIASEQINAFIEERLQGGQVDTSPQPLSEGDKQILREEKNRDLWRQFSDFPISEMVFNLARATMAASDTPYAGLFRNAKFDPTQIDALQKAVKTSVDMAAEIRKSAGERLMSVESLKLRLAESNPTLTADQLTRLGEAVEAVYNEEVQKSSRRALDEVIRKHAEKKTAKKISKDNDFVTKLLPLLNMGAFSDEAAYNAISERLRLPTWNAEVAAEIEAKAQALQELPEGSLQRQEATVTLMSDILKAQIKEAKGLQNFSSVMQISSALWSAGILSGPPTQIVNASMTTVSVFAESIAEATGYALADRKNSTEYFKDIARAWVFAFGKDANNTGARAVNEAFTALTKGQTKFKSEKMENMSPLEMFKFDPKVAIPGVKMMEAITSGDFKQATKEAGKMAIGVPWTMGERLVKLDAKGAVRDYMATTKLVGRLMLAADSMNSFGAATTKQMMMKRYLMSQEGMSETEVQKTMRDIRRGGEESVREGAIAQAEYEAERGDFGPSGSRSFEIAKARRVEQLIEQQGFGADVVNTGRDFAATATFNSEPYGTVGWLMDTLFAGPTKVLGLITKPINPFPKTMSNLVNAALNYTPYGYARSYGVNLGTLLAKSDRYPQQFFKAPPENGSPEFYAMNAKATAGTAAAGIFFMMLAKALEEREEGKEPWFEIHGPGPSDWRARKQWLASGAKAFTVKLGRGEGAVVVNFVDWPGINLMLGALGTWYDQQLYSNTETDLADELFSTARAVFMTTLNRNALGGASGLLEVIAGTTPDSVAQNRLKQLASSYASGFTRPSFVRWVETIATGTRQETSTMSGWLLSMAPVVSAFRDKPALNLLGEPIEITKWDATAGRISTTQETHPVLTPLTNAQLWITPPESYKIYDPSSPTMVRDMTKAELYDYSKEYGETLSSMLPPATAEMLANMANTAPNMAQEQLRNICNTAANRAKARMKGRGVLKGKELKGP